MYASSVPNDIHFYHQNRIYQCHICSWEIPYCSSNCLCVDWLSYGIFVDEIWWEFSVHCDMIILICLHPCVNLGPYGFHPEWRCGTLRLLPSTSTLIAILPWTALKNSRRYYVTSKEEKTLHTFHSHLMCLLLHSCHYHHGSMNRRGRGVTLCRKQL